MCKRKEVYKSDSERGNTVLWKTVKRREDRPRRNFDKDYDRLLEAARETEYNLLAKTIRDKRDKLLADTDWSMMADVTMEEQKRESYRTYRQALRDITKQEDFPYNVIFPILEV